MPEVRLASVAGAGARRRISACGGRVWIHVDMRRHDGYDYYHRDDLVGAGVYAQECRKYLHRTQSGYYDYGYNLCKEDLAQEAPRPPRLPRNLLPLTFLTIFHTTLLKNRSRIKYIVGA